MTCEIEFKDQSTMTLMCTCFSYRAQCNTQKSICSKCHSSIFPLGMRNQKVTEKTENITLNLMDTIDNILAFYKI